MIITCLALLATAATAARATRDPCAGIAAGAPLSVARAAACLLSVPFSAARAARTLDALLASFDLYTFRDLAAAPPDPHFDAHDVVAALAALRGRAFPSQLAFELAVVAAVRALNDAHTRFRPSKCFQEWSFINPVPLFAFRAAGASESTLAVLSPTRLAERFAAPSEAWGKAVDVASEALGWSQWHEAIDLATVTAIDGDAPWRAIGLFANSSVGTSKSLETREKLALTWFLPDHVTVGQFSKRALTGRASLPPDSVTFALAAANGRKLTLEVPFVAFSANEIVSAAGFARYCGTTSNTADVNDDLALFDPETDRPPHRPPLSVREPTKLKSPVQFESIVNSTYVDMWFGASKTSRKTLAMWMGSFSVSGKAGFTQWKEALTKGFGIAKDRGADHLLIDLTQNGGGNICAGAALLNFTGLFGKLPYYTAMPTSLLANELASNVVNTTDYPWSSGAWLSAATGKTFTDDSWLTAGRVLQRGKNTRGFSKLIHLDCSAEGLPAPVTTPLFSPRNVTIVTHSYCGSTCSEFVQHASLYEHVRTVVVGTHDAEHNAQITSFPGGQVFESTVISDTIAMANAQGSFVPDIPNISFRLAGREVYGPRNHDIPLEFTWLPPDDVVYVDQNDAQRFGSYWSQL